MIVSAVVLAIAEAGAHFANAQMNDPTGELIDRFLRAMVGAPTTIGTIG